MSRKVFAGINQQIIKITKKDLERAEKVVLVQVVTNGEYMEYIPITIMDRELKEWTSRMDRGLILKGQMFETGYLPLSIFIFDIEDSYLRKEE
jgi:hypothetical protein